MSGVSTSNATASVGYDVLSTRTVRVRAGPAPHCLRCTRRVLLHLWIPFLVMLARSCSMDTPRAVASTESIALGERSSATSDALMHLRALSRRKGRIAAFLFHTHTSRSDLDGSKEGRLFLGGPIRDAAVCCARCGERSSTSETGKGLRNRKGATLPAEYGIRMPPGRSELRMKINTSLQEASS